jgi:DNA-binding CsgD family transcriptional regulator/PAS domain-containing protein
MAVVETSEAIRDGRQHFAAALQSALTMREVERAFLDAAGSAIPAGGFGLYRIDPTSGDMLDAKAEVEVDFLGEYEEYGRRDDPVLEFVLRHNRPIDSSRVVQQSVWERCGARSAINIGGYYHSLEAPVSVSGVLYGTINFARNDDYGPFSDADLVSARLAGEQLGLATERALRYERTGKRTTTLEHVLDRLPQAVVVTDLEARVIFRNRAARLDHPAHAHDGSLRLVEDSIVEAMEEFRHLGKRVATRTARDPHTQRRVIVKSYRLPDRDDAAMTIVFECAPSGVAHLPAWDVLSKREQEIAELVSRGLTNKQIAEQAFVSENTVKQHLKRVFSKTDVRNRAELMQRIWAAGGGETDGGDAAADWAER